MLCGWSRVILSHSLANGWRSRRTPRSVYVIAEAFRAFPQRIFDSAVVKDAEVLRLRSGFAMRTRYFAQDDSVEKISSS